MPNVYRLKNCLYCNKPFRKRGQYCSRSCGNHRNYSHTKYDTLNQIKSIKQKEFFKTPQGISTLKSIVNTNKNKKINKSKLQNNQYILKPDDYAINIPSFDDDDNITW